MLALADEGDGRIWLVDKFEMNNLVAEPNPRVEILVLELERSAEQSAIEANGVREVRGAQLRNDAHDMHSVSNLLRGA